jgi:hypothetical protein
LTTPGQRLSTPKKAIREWNKRFRIFSEGEGKGRTDLVISQFLIKSVSEVILMKFLLKLI